MEEGEGEGKGRRTGRGWCICCRGGCVFGR